MELLGFGVTAFFSIVTSVFAFLAYRHSRDRFRLELFEKRWAIYEQTVNFCSVVLQEGGFPSKGSDNAEERLSAFLKSAGESFRGLGGHKAKLLFGNDIKSRFDYLNEAYAYLVTYGSREGQRSESFDSKKYWDYVKGTVELLENLPKQFSPYLYFGDYRARHK